MKFLFKSIYVSSDALVTDYFNVLLWTLNNKFVGINHYKKMKRLIVIWEVDSIDFVKRKKTYLMLIQIQDQTTCCVIFYLIKLLFLIKNYQNSCRVYYLLRSKFVIKYSKTICLSASKILLGLLINSSFLCNLSS